MIKIVKFFMANDTIWKLIDNKNKQTKKIEVDSNYYKNGIKK